MDKVLAKEAQRNVGLSARNAVGAESARRFSRAICEKLIADPVFMESGIILSYYPVGGEVDTGFFNSQAVRMGKRVAFPICYSDGHMAAAIPAAPDGWETGLYGIQVPLQDCSHIIDASEIDLAIIPCVAFDGATRARIGRGAGYYDRYLPLCAKAVSIAVAFDAQRIDGICSDAWDIPVDAVITEIGRY
ncbi:MAG: 5-formyltetrahydrofolate cyclo-ligase [Clostridiales Family XIII bacterium]|jgi:5-formyltetrahydrofolate cyclo-ligase|nr:5-formyltetrahydrofolate cyclo-ligase [Clostridiales Family XIII bacterium]